VLINCFDQDLAPTPAALRTQINAYKPEQNLFIAVVGIDAPEGVSVFDFADKKLKQFKTDLALATPQPPEMGVRKIEETNNGNLKFSGNIDFVKPLRSSVWHDANNHREEIKKLLAANRVLYKNYQALRGFQVYFDTTTPSSFAPYSFTVPKELHKLFLADVALRMRSKNLEEKRLAFREFSENIQTWRVMMSGEGSLVPHLTGVVFLHEDYLLLSDVIADSAIDLSDVGPLIEQMLLACKDADWKLGKSIAWEFRENEVFWKNFEVNLKLSASAQKSWWDVLSGFFYESHASENLNAQRFEQLVKLADSDPDKLMGARKAYRKWVEHNLSWQVGYIYNPVGKTLAYIGTPRDDIFLMQCYDVAALQRLVRLGFQIRKQKIIDADIPTFIAQHPELASHPVDGHAFTFNSASREISLTPLSGNSTDQRFSIPVFNFSSI